MGVNYSKTLIAVADDCPVTKAVAPPRNEDKPTIAAQQYRLLSSQPRELTSEDVIFQVHADKQGIPESERPVAREAYFAAPRACLRASPLPKKFGWGLYSDEEGRVELLAMESPEYRRLVSGEDGVKVVKAMRSSRK